MYVTHPIFSLVKLRPQNGKKFDLNLLTKYFGSLTYKKMPLLIFITLGKHIKHNLGKKKSAGIS